MPLAIYVYRRKKKEMLLVATVNFSLAGGGGGTLLCKPYRYVPPQKVWFLRRFGLETGIDFAHIGLESGVVFEGTTGVYERHCRFNSK